jgi:hypothetical protein
MRDTYAGTAAALRDALRHAVEHGGFSSLGALHAGAPCLSVLGDEYAAAQAGRIRRQLDRLQPVPRALLLVAYAPRDVVCACGSRCCAGHYPNPEWQEALGVVLEHTAPLLASKVPNRRLRETLIANLLRHTHETHVALAQRCGVHRLTVADHAAILEAALMGTRREAGAFDAAFARVDALLRTTGIVTDADRGAAAQPPALTAHARAATPPQCVSLPA